MKEHSRMAKLYANENFPRPVVVRLRALGQDALTSREAACLDAPSTQITKSHITARICGLTPSSRTSWGPRTRLFARGGQLYGGFVVRGR